MGENTDTAFVLKQEPGTGDLEAYRGLLKAQNSPCSISRTRQILENLQDLNMVQELGYESCAMFPGRQTSAAYNMNLAGAFGYASQQLPQTAATGQYSAVPTPDYAQFSMADVGPLQQTTSPTTTCSWASTCSSMAGMYGPPCSSSSGAAARQSPASAPGLDDWAGTVNSPYVNHHQQQHHPQQHQQLPVGMCPTSSSTASTSPGGYPAYRPGTLPHLPSDYSPPPQQHHHHNNTLGTPAGMGLPLPHHNHHHGLSSASPSPTGGVIGAQGSHGQAVGLAAQRVQNRAPYDWMKKQTYPAAPISGKTRTKDKYRVVYTDHQRLELEKEFHYSRYITIRRKAELAQALSLSERQVKIWFQNRRAKERKQNKKREETLTGGSSRPDQAQIAHTTSLPPVLKTEPMSVGQTSPITQNISVSQQAQQH